MSEPPSSFTSGEQPLGKLHLENAYKACKSAVQCERSVRLDWQDGVNINARNLSAFTVLAVKRVTAWPSYEEAKASVMEFLARDDEHAHKPSMSWQGLLAEALSWLQLKMSPVHFGHVSKSAPLCALPRSALARQETQLALVVPELLVSSETAVTQTAYVRAFEAAALGRKSSSFTGAEFLEKLKNALTPPTKGSDAYKRSKILTKLHLLAVEVDDVDEICALLYVFSLDLVVTGTRGKSQLAPATPYQYVFSFAEDFHSATNGLSLRSVDEETYAKIIQKLLGSTGDIAPYKLAGLKVLISTES